MHISLKHLHTLNTRRRSHQIPQTLGGRNFMMLFLFLLVVLILSQTTKAQIILLNGILFALTVAATNAFSSESLISKGSPWTEVLATLAPLDFQTTLDKDPYGYVASRTQTLVLARNHVTGIFIVGYGCNVLFALFLRATKDDIAIGSRCGAHAMLATHDARSLAVVGRN